MPSACRVSNAHLERQDYLREANPSAGSWLAQLLIGRTLHVTGAVNLGGAALTFSGFAVHAVPGTDVVLMAFAPGAIPTLDPLALIVLAFMLAAIAIITLRR